MSSRRLLYLSIVFALVSGFALADEPEIVIHKGSVIAFEGDSLTYGMDVSPAGVRTQINGSGYTRSVSPIPETVAKDLDGCATAINRGYPGDRSVDGLVRWQAVAPADLVFLMFGSNDATNFGRSATGVANVPTFTAVMRILVDRRRAQGAQVVLLVPPPISIPAAETMIRPYRSAIIQLGRELGIKVLDVSNPLLTSSAPFTPDNVHFSAEGNANIAKFLASKITCH